MCGEPEPHTITAGDSLAWTRSVPEYPASAGWTLTYGIAGAVPIQFAATTGTDGVSYAVAVAPNVTAAWCPGTRIWSAYLTQGSPATARHTVAHGRFTILPNPAATTAALNHAQKALGLIEAALEKRIPAGLEDTTIDGQQLVRMAVKDLYDLREKYKREVIALERAAAAAAGLPPRARVRTPRFVRPSPLPLYGAGFLFPLDY